MKTDSPYFYPCHILQKLQAIDPNVIDRLESHADALYEAWKADCYIEPRRDDAGTIIPNPLTVGFNIMAAVYNRCLSQGRQAHLFVIGDAHGEKLIALSGNMASAMLHYIDRDAENILPRAGISAKELDDMRRYRLQADAVPWLNFPSPSL